MYNHYPQYDVPQNNVIQRFFAQRWSAIVIEILMTIVITAAAGHAFDFFGPFDAPPDVGSSATAPAIMIEESLPLASIPAADALPLRTIERKARAYFNNGQYAEAAALVDLLSLAKPESAHAARYLEIARFYDILGKLSAYFELVGENASSVAQLVSGAARGAD